MILAILLVGSQAATAKKPGPPRMEDLVGIWVGRANAIDYFRLDLAPDGTGLLAFVELDSVRLYRVSRWSLDGIRVRIALKPIDEADWEMKMGGTATSHSLQLTVNIIFEADNTAPIPAGSKGAERLLIRKNERQERATLLPERLVEAAKEKALQRMKEFQKSKNLR